jgi:hypothetical protein
MTTKVKKEPIHAIGSLNKMTDGVLSPYLDATVKGLTANATIYPKPPIDLTTYGTAVSAYDASITAALDGGRTAVAQKNKLKKAAIKLYGQQAKYVEANCNDDMPTFLLSGFQARATTKNPATTANDAIRHVKRGSLSGVMIITLMKVTGASSYQVRFSATPPGGPAGPWTTQSIPAVKPPTTLTGLTPGSTYAFQACALLKTGTFTNWSDSVTMMCV